MTARKGLVGRAGLAVHVASPGRRDYERRIFLEEGSGWVQTDGLVRRHLEGPTVTMPKPIPEERALRAVQKWTEDEIALVGQLSDATVARRLGRSTGAVKRIRCKLGLPQVDAKLKRWTGAENALLGTMPDKAVAQQTHRKLEAVRAHRHALNIPGCPWSLAYRWTPEADALLGTIPDVEAAGRLRRDSKTVARRRAQLGIPRYRKPEWPPEQDALLGTMSDVEVALKINRNMWSVYRRRCRLGIPRYLEPGAKIPTPAIRVRPRPSSPRPKLRRWTPEEDALLKTLTPQAAAAQLNRTLGSVRYRCMARGVRSQLRVHWTPALVALLGTMPDAELAKKLGCRLVSVGVRRRKLRIPAKLASRSAWTKAEIALLGTLTDEQTAQALNRPLRGVRSRRIRLRIPCLRKTGAGRKAAAPPSRSDSL